MATTSKVTPLIMVKQTEQADEAVGVREIAQLRAAMEARQARLDPRADAIKVMEAKLNHPAFGFTQAQRDAVKAFIEVVR